MALEGQNGKMAIGDIVKDAEESYKYLKQRHDSETKLEVFVVSIVLFVATGLILLFASAFAGVQSIGPGGDFAGGIAAGVIGGLATYYFRRKRGFKFAELGAMVANMKGKEVTSEDALRLMDALHGAMLAVKKGNLDSAFSNAVAAFIIIGILSLNAGTGLLAGTIVYLYFRFEAIRGYEKEERKYEESRKELLQSL